MLLAWHKYGGGKDPLAKLYASIGANVVSFLYGPMPTQPLGWFQEPVTSVDNLQGLKFRTVGFRSTCSRQWGPRSNAVWSRPDLLLFAKPAPAPAEFS